MQLFTTTQDLCCVQLLNDVKAHYLEGQEANLDAKKDISVNFYNYVNKRWQER